MLQKSLNTATKKKKNWLLVPQNEKGAIGWAFLWLIGIPIPILVLLFLFRGCT
jgi:hypothetical protein